jgi:hypothetical protein
MLGGGTMGLRCQFVQFGGFPVFLVHGDSSCGRALDSPYR